jgi:hypothetical protein
MIPGWAELRSDKEVVVNVVGIYFRKNVVMKGKKEKKVHFGLFRIRITKIW